MCKKNFIPISIGFCVIALHSYREILNKRSEKKGNNSAQKQFFNNLRNQVLDIRMRNVMIKLESSRLNGVNVIAKTYIYTHTYTHIHTHTADLR